MKTAIQETLEIVRPKSFLLILLSILGNVVFYGGIFYLIGCMVEENPIQWASAAAIVYLAIMVIVALIAFFTAKKHSYKHYLAVFTAVAITIAVMSVL